MSKFDRITVNPETMNGQPCIRNMRLTVKRVVAGLAVTQSWPELMAEYPGLEEEDIRQALAWASGSMDDQVLQISAG